VVMPADSAWTNRFAIVGWRRCAARRRNGPRDTLLDQCWDLLRQRRALREFGKDPDEAKVRPAKIVENYEQ
jgi:hypothetical protein